MLWGCFIFIALRASARQKTLHHLLDTDILVQCMELGNKCLELTL
jgi:hypothetical protein